MAVSLNTSAALDDFAGVSPFSVSVTIGAGSNIGAIVWINTFEALTITSVTVGGQACTLISNTKANDNGLFIEGWGRIGGLVAGATTAVVTFSAPASLAISVSVVVANDTDLIDNGANTLADTSPGNLAMTSPANDMSTTFSVETASDTDATSSQTVLTTSWARADRKTTISGANPTHTWTTVPGSSQEFNISGANFRAAGAGGGRTTHNTTSHPGGISRGIGLGIGKKITN